MLFFLVMEAFLVFIFYQYDKIEEEHIQENLFLEMKNYSFFFDDKRFDMDLVPAAQEKKLYELYIDNDLLYILVPFPSGKDDLLKIFYPRSSYEKLLSELRSTIAWQFLLLSFIAFLISLLFALYALSPLRNALRMMEVFIKDIIHDLNTPITSILINLKMMDPKNEEVESISQSARTISMLHNNLNAYLDQSKKENEKFPLKEVIAEQVSFFRSLYDYLEWDINIDDEVLLTDKNAFSRILYNLLSNACKYNKANGFIKIYTQEGKLYIENDSHGVQNPVKVFERFYKESERGLGIGLHIVDMLCKTLDIEKSFRVKENIVKVTLDLSEVTLK